MTVAVLTLADAGRQAHVDKQKQALARWAPEVRHVQSELGPDRNLARARNAAGDRAVADGAEHLIFLDADCIPGPELVERYRDCLTRHPADVACGPVTYLDPPGPAEPADRADPAGHARGVGAVLVLVFRRHGAGLAVDGALRRVLHRLRRGGHRLRFSAARRRAHAAVGGWGARLPPVASGVLAAVGAPRRHPGQRGAFPSPVGDVADARVVGRFRRGRRDRLRPRPVAAHPLDSEK